MVYLAQMVFFSDLPRPSLGNVFNGMETTPVLQTSNSILTGFAAKQESVVRQRSRIWDYKKTMKKVGDNQDDYHVLSRTKEG